MIGKDTLNVDLTQQFTMRERFRILFGWQLVIRAKVEVTAKANMRRKIIEFSHVMGQHQTFIGKPQSQLPPPPNMDALRSLYRGLGQHVRDKQLASPVLPQK